MTTFVPLFAILRIYRNIFIIHVNKKYVTTYLYLFVSENIYCKYRYETITNILKTKDVETFKTNINMFIIKISNICTQKFQIMKKAFNNVNVYDTFDKKNQYLS